MFDVFLFLLLITSAMTSLFVEGIKKMLGDKYNFSSNILAGIVAVVVGLVVGIFYFVLAELTFSAQVVIYLISLVALSWLCAMIGYDKVVQAITQLKTSK